jgi:hypothetical protein
LDLVVHDARDADPARLGDPLQPRRDVDAVAVNVAVFDDHIARVDADAELDALVLGGCIVPRRHLPLQRDGAGDRFDDAREFDQDSIAGSLDDASLVLGDLRVDQIAAQRPEARQGAGLVPFHQAAVSHDVGRQNGREPALDPLCAQPVLPGDPVRPSILRRFAGFRYMLNSAYTGEML